MTKADELRALADRCEAAMEGGNFALDTDIAYGIDFPLEGIAKPYTASLDAAMTLVPEELGFQIDGYGSAWFADCSADVENLQGRAVSPALALCAASLRALASLEEGK